MHGARDRVNRCMVRLIVSVGISVKATQNTKSLKEHYLTIGARSLCTCIQLYPWLRNVCWT